MGRLLTVFSSSRYCGGTNEAACVLADSRKLRMIRLDTGWQPLVDCRLQVDDCSTTNLSVDGAQCTLVVGWWADMRPFVSVKQEDFVSLVDCGNILHYQIHAVSLASHVSTRLLIHLSAHLTSLSPLSSSITLSLRAQNLPFQQILPTLILLPVDCLMIMGPDKTYRASRYIFSLLFL